VEWQEWEEELIREHRFYSNTDIAELVLPHRTENSVRARRLNIKSPHLVRCKKCALVMPKSTKYEICTACCSKAERSSNITIRFAEYRSSARSRDIKWDLTIGDFVKLWNSHCAYCNDKIDGIGIDRIDSSDAYRAGNITPACGTCNKMKSVASLDQWLSHINKIVQHTGAKDGDRYNQSGSGQT